jgi:branched-chain amino acid transport system ATP-binding protein
LGAICSVKNLEISFGSNHVLRGVSFDVEEGEVIGIVGPNGAGKTVLLNIITGILKPSGGEILFQGRDITKSRIVERTRMGIGRTFQVPRSFENMSVYENVLLGGMYGRLASESEAGRAALDIIDGIGMADKTEKAAGSLGLLDRKRLEIGIALASRPKLLLMDEAAGGLKESEIEDILEIVRRAQQDGVSIIWIEHVLQTMVDGTDRVLCLAEGRDVICGPSREVMSSREVREAYLGADEDDF